MLSHAWDGIADRSDGMRGEDILLLGIGGQPPWQLMDQHLDTSKEPPDMYGQPLCATRSRTLIYQGFRSDVQPSVPYRDVRWG